MSWTKLFLAVLIVGFLTAGTLAGPTSASIRAPALPVGQHDRLAVLPASPPEEPPAIASPLTLAASASSNAVCAFGVSDCPAGTPYVNLTLHATASSNASAPIQVLFVVDATLFAGGCDPGAGDGGCSKLGVSDALPQFLGNASGLAGQIAASHPGANVTFALALTQATLDQFDDGDGPAYLVAASNFSAPSAFGAEVNGSYAAQSIRDDVDWSDNLLDSPLITGLYGGLTGQAVNWTNGTGHVVIVVSATAPRDPAYIQNLSAISSSNATTPSCEPSYVFSGGPSPTCEGWVVSQTANASDSIASLASNSTDCRASATGFCTIDSIVLNATPTDVASPGWTASYSGGNKSVRILDASAVVAAGCDLASSTGGSWSGPIGSTCGGVNGTLAFSGDGNTTDPWLDAAISAASLGPMPSAPVAGGSRTPLFRYVPGPNVTVIDPESAVASCTTPVGPFAECDSTPTIGTVGGTTALSWNWSADPRSNSLYRGDIWTVTVSLRTTGPASAETDLLDCGALTCASEVEGSAVAGASAATSATFVPFGIGEPVAQVFPRTTIVSEGPRSLQGGLTDLRGAGAAPFVAHFAAVTVDGAAPFMYLWSFGDGATASTTSSLVNHTYEGIGWYSASVTIADASGATATASTEVHVVPVLAFVAYGSPVSGVAPLVVSFGTDVTGGAAPTTVAWSFGDGATGLGDSPTHTFSSPGSYTVSSVAADAAGDVVTSQVQIAVAAAPPPPNPLGVSVVPTTVGTGCAATSEVQFAATATGGTAPYTISWAFGDGASAVGPTVTHFYPGRGPYTATVTAQDSAGQIATAQATVTPTSALSATCAAPTSTGTSPVPGTLLSVVPFVVLGVVLVAAALGVITYGTRRRRRPPPRAVRPKSARRS